MAVLQSCEEDIVKAPIMNGNPIELDIDTIPELQTVGGAIKRSFAGINGGNRVLILRTSENSFLVLSAICTHQGCEVDEPVSMGADIVCPCHEARFSSANGKVLQGPAAADLAVYAAHFNPETQILTLNAPDNSGPEEPKGSVRILLDDEPALLNIGGAIKKNFAPYNKKRDVIIIRTGRAEFLAASSVCSHNSCDVGLPAKQGANLVCPCHGAEYSAHDGSWQPSPQQANDLKTFGNSFDSTKNELTIVF